MFVFSSHERLIIYVGIHYCYCQRLFVSEKSHLIKIIPKVKHLNYFAFTKTEIRYEGKYMFYFVLYEKVSSFANKKSNPFNVKIQYWIMLLFLSAILFEIIF